MGVVQRPIKQLLMFNVCLYGAQIRRRKFGIITSFDRELRLRYETKYRSVATEANHGGFKEEEDRGKDNLKRWEFVLKIELDLLC